MWAKDKQPGFTIVELLIVIVVIGILAAITILAYNGIQGRAVAASLTSDLTNASTKLKLYQVDNSSYPNSINDCPSPAVGNTCLKTSSNNTYTDFQVDNTASPQALCLAARNVNGTSYHVTDSSASSPGDCSPASCLSILNDAGSVGSGIYWIKPAGAGAPIRVYCDMVTSGGGWTLLICNPGPYTIWNLTTVYSLNSASPSISSPYSILNKADSIKTNISGNLQYRIDAVTIGHWGGVWQAPFTNTFIGTSALNNATNIEKYDSWTIDTTLNDTTALTNVMPWVSNNTQLLSTWGGVGSWWGTLVTGSSGWAPAPYMSVEKQAPGIIWFWVK
ncbi:prepilin-type N-terminal cleavage/methylation domain-containing protein [Candidatus Saccharibacteria bacterium]|nr:prepilin-type N-terminal cleavage/methylation domain-containing protein [Candidatus Saccharibacteria bacterium]